MSATSVQYFTLCLEVIGIVLAFIEIKYPIIADRIEVLFVRIEPFSNKAIDRFKLEKRDRDQLMGNDVLLLTYISLLLPFILFNLLIRLLNKTSSGKALGMLGLILALVGFTIEVIQLFM